MSCLSKVEPPAPKTWVSCLINCPNLLVTQGTEATPPPDCPAGVISQHMHTPCNDHAHSKPRPDVHLPYVCAFGQEMHIARIPRDEQSTSDSVPSASQRDEFALGVTDPLTEDISGPSRWRGQGWQCPMPKGATIQVLIERPWTPDRSRLFICLCICFKKV